MPTASGYSPWRNGKALFAKQLLRWKRSTFILLFMVALPVVALILLKVLDILISDAIDRSGFFGTATQSPPTLPISLQTGTDRANKWEIIDGKYQGPRFAMCNADGSDFGNKDVLAKTADGIWTSLYPIASTIPGTPAGYTIPEVTTHADRAALAKHIHDTWDTQFSRLDFFGNMGVPYPNKAFLVTNSYTNAPAGLTMGVDVALNGTAVSYREMSSVFSLFKSALANSVSGKSLKLKSSYKDFPQESVAGINVVHLVAGYFFTPICQFFIPFTATSLVFEKEHKLRMIMRMMGLRSLEYWIVELIFFVALSTVFNLLIIGTGVLLDLDIFAKNSFLGLFYMLTCWTVSAFGQSIIFSTLFSSERTATIVCWAYALIISIIAQVINALELFTSGSGGWNVWWIPPIGLNAAIGRWGNAAEPKEHSLTLSNCFDPTNVFGRISYALLLSGPVLTVIGLYLDRVMPSVDVTEPWWFPLNPRTWIPIKSRVPPQDAVTKYLQHRPDNVKQEAVKCYTEGLELRGQGRVPLASRFGLLIVDLHKSFTSIGFFKKNEIKAVNGINYAIKRGECFGFLGHNGAGKCLGLDTPVLMHDGSFRPVQDVKAGERVMGDDGTPRTVTSTTVGTDEMARVTLDKGAVFTCNMPHVLSLKMAAPITSDERAVTHHTIERDAEGLVVKITPVATTHPTEEAAQAFIDEILASQSHQGAEVVHPDTTIDISVRDLLTEQHAGVKPQLLAYHPDGRTESMTIDRIGEGEYYGFTLDGNRRFIITHDRIVTHNTTTINTLAGIIKPTSGVAFVNGYDINTQMSKIHRCMGICPQDDITWPNLTGAEHLRFFARLKGVPEVEVGKHVYEGLESVRLARACDIRKHVGAYSGGMRRRLSVAIAFMGNPDVVLLDEPTTGLDPETRRGLWDIIAEKKEGRTILLTTHSMEEADALCNRLAIMKEGRVAVLGAPAQLKKELGENTYSLVINCNPPRPAGVSLEQHEANVDATVARTEQFISGLIRSAKLQSSVAGSMRYDFEVAGTKEEEQPDLPTLSSFSRAMKQGASGVGIVEWGVASTSLESVFIKVQETIQVEDDEPADVVQV